MKDSKKHSSTSPNNSREKLISQKTYDRVKIAKSYIEKKYKMKHVKELEKKRGDIKVIGRLGNDQP
jgi:hypothetical protein